MHANHQRRCAALAAALSAGLLGDDDTPSAMFHDLDQIAATIQHLQHEAGYPATTLHTVAVKANPVTRLLRFFQQQGVGAEAASLGELHQALRAGFAPERVVFDSPAKTVAELRYALQAGVAVNLDNFQELQRAAALVAAEPGLLQHRHQQLIGLRINPQVGEGSIAALSTGGRVSKFGFPLQEVRGEIIQAFQQHAWLNMLHLHVGSQGLPLATVIAGISAVWQLLQDVEQQCGRGRVQALDIGGGLAVDYSTDEAPEVTVFQAQAAQLAAALPALFAADCPVRLMTENGRSLLAKSGFTASRVEYTKWCGGRYIAVTHVGADLFMRACYLPDTWGLRVFVCDARGAPKTAGGAAGSEMVPCSVAGPLCFQGDHLVVNKPMLKPDVGDYIVVVDTGAYCLSMYSRYNSRCSPAVFGFSSAAGGAPGTNELPAERAVQLELLRAAETLEQMSAFWD